FMAPVLNGVRTQFLTTRAAARHMIPARRGVILAFGGTGDTFAKLGGLTVGLDAIEALRRQWSVELGPHNIRVVTLQTGGITETIPPDMPGGAEIIKSLEDSTLLGRAATLADVGEAAAFVASDKARTITGSAINITCGAILDYR
ncbi:MAG: SDR family oxidoreductase, partial [Stackebrandtia sp.]